MELNCKLYVVRKVYESIFQRFKRCLNPNFLEKVMPVLQNSVWAENGLAFERPATREMLTLWTFERPTEAFERQPHGAAEMA